MSFKISTGIRKMLLIQEDAEIVFYSKPTKLCKGVNGLSEIVRNEIAMDIKPNTFFLFVNLKRTMVKILYLDKTNLATWFKRLDGTLMFKYSNQIVIFNKKELMDFLDKMAFLRRYKFERFSVN